MTVRRETETAVPATASEPRSFESAFAEYRMPMVRLADVITGSNEVAEEIVQEAFVRLHRRWADVQNPPGFLRTIVTNLCRTEVRRGDSEMRRSRQPVTSINDPELDETWTAVCRLPFRQRVVLALRYYLDLPEAEIAQILGCRLGTVKSAHHRGIAKLREEPAMIEAATVEDRLRRTYTTVAAVRCSPRVTSGCSRRGSRDRAGPHRTRPCWPVRR